ncbi:MAG: class I SAM-dependent methyltransferase [Nocardioidaceae bacterium]
MMWIDDEGVHIPLSLGDALALEIGGRQVWAFVPPRDGRRVDSHRLVAWPELLVPHLNGQADVVLRALDSGKALLECSVTLGTGEGVLELVDPTGRPLRVDKGNHVTAKMFADASDDERAILVDAVAQALDFMSARGHDAFLAFGNLLGAVRDGKLIGHDNDADVAVLAKATHPVDVILESMALEREFHEAGWETLRMSGGDFKLFAKLSDGRKIGIDVFSAFYLEGKLHVMPCVAADLPRERLLPTSTVELEGRKLAAPADPEALLEATYGPGWRQPDPAFKYKPPRWLRRRLTGLMRGERRHEKYWQVFYTTKASKVPSEPSSFAQWVAGLTPRPKSLVDVGCGTGRDALWLSGQGIDVLGCDYSGPGLRFAAERAKEQGRDTTFRKLNLYDLRRSLTVGALLARERSTDAVYARFVVHALESDGRNNLWRFSRAVLRRTRGRLYLEFRTEATEHEFGEHFRQFVQPEVVCGELESYGFAIEHCEDRYGLAVHKNEDPRVCRIIAKMED